MHTYFGNHNKTIGSIVQIARWDEPTLKAAAAYYNIKQHLIDEVKFKVMGWCKSGNKLYLEVAPMHDNHGNKLFMIEMDETNLIKVGP